MMKHFAYAVIGVLTFMLSSHAFAADKTFGDLELKRAYARAMVPVAKTGGGYLTIINHGKSDDRLISASSDRSPTVEIHEMSMDGGVMKMQEMKEGIVLPAGGTVAFGEDGYHLMFMNVPKPFKEGETVKVNLVFEKAGKTELDFLVGPLVGLPKSFENGEAGK